MLLHLFLYNLVSPKKEVKVRFLFSFKLNFVKSTNKIWWIFSDKKKKIKKIYINFFNLLLLL